MAAFGSFAGLASAGVGALCSYEANALNMFDFTPRAAPSIDRFHQDQHRQSAAPSADISRAGDTINQAREQVISGGGRGSEDPVSIAALDILTIWPC